MEAQVCLSVVESLSKLHASKLLSAASFGLKKVQNTSSSADFLSLWSLTTESLRGVIENVEFGIGNICIILVVSLKQHCVGFGLGWTFSETGTNTEYKAFFFTHRQ